MSRRGICRSGGSTLWAALCVATLSAAAVSPASARQADAPKITFYPSFQLKFVDGEAHNYFISNAGVVNVSGGVLTDLTITQRFPQGFTPTLISKDAQALLMRPEGFTESLDGGVYTVHLPELRIAEATALVVRLDYQGRPGETTIPGIEAKFTSNGEQLEEKGPDLDWGDLSKFTKYSGTLREYIKRYAGLDMKIPAGDWGFTNLAARVAGRVASKVVEVDTEGGGRMRFSIAAGDPGDLRQMLVIRRPYDPARHAFKAKDEVRRFIGDLVSVTADFTLDPDEFSIREEKIGRYRGWVAHTLWHDKVKDRLGGGPSRWYIITDEKAGFQYIINISAQGRGIGPGKADTPTPDKDKALMSELEGMVSSLRIL